MSVHMHSQGLPDDDQGEWHSTRISLPRGIQLHTLHTNQTFFVKASGRGSRSVSPEAIMSALVAKGYIPTEVATKPNIDWYLEEETGNRCFVVKSGIEEVSNATDGATLYIGMSGPNFPTGHTVRVDITHSSSKENTFRLEYLPYLADERLVCHLASFFCNEISATRDKDRTDTWWVKTTTRLEELPHWVIVDNLVSNVPHNRLLVSVKDRDVQCFYCRDTSHWTNTCKDKKQREKEERQRFVERRKLEKQQQQIQYAKEQKEEEEREKEHNEDHSVRLNMESFESPSQHARQGFPPYMRYEDLSPEPEGEHQGNRSRVPLETSPTSLPSEPGSPNSAQLAPVYSSFTSSGSPPSAQPPKKCRKTSPQNNVNCPKRNDDSAHTHDVSWQQEVIDTLSPIARKREVIRKLNNDLAKLQEKKAGRKEREIKEQVALDQKRKESRKKQLANEVKQKQESMRLKELKQQARQKKKDDNLLMDTFAEQASKEKSETQTAQSQPSSKGQSLNGSKAKATRPAVAIALFTETEDPNKMPPDQHSVDGHGISDTPANLQHNADPQEKADVPDEQEDIGPSSTSTPRPSSRPSPSREPVLHQPCITPKAPAPFCDTPHTPIKCADELGATGTSCGKPKVLTTTPPKQVTAKTQNSIIDFYGSDPESGISQLITFLTSPKYGQKRLNNLSTSHDDSKRPSTANQSLAWQDESLRLHPDPDPTMPTTQKPYTPTTEEPRNCNP